MEDGDVCLLIRTTGECTITPGGGKHATYVVARALSRVHGATSWLSAELQVGDVYVEQMRDTKPGDSVRIDGRPWLGRYLGPIDEKPHV